MHLISRIVCLLRSFNLLLVFFFFYVSHYAFQHFFFFFTPLRSTFKYFPVSIVYYLRDPQTFFSNKTFIKNEFHSTIHTFKNYFITVFLIFSKISCIQTDLTHYISSLLILSKKKNLPTILVQTNRGILA